MVVVMMRRRFSLVPLLLAMVWFAAGCAQNAPEPRAPSAREAARGPDAAATATPVVSTPKEEAAAGDTLEGQLAALAAAEGEIEQVLASGVKKAAERERDEAAKAPVAGGRPAAGRAGAAPAKAGDAGSVGASCSLACSALASMNRAVSRLCALAGEGDRRCEDGRSRERSATQRVHASCPSCSG